MEAENSACKEVRVGETGCHWRAETKEFLEGLEEVLKGVRFALVETLNDGLAEPCRGKKVLFHLGRLFLQPDEDSVKRSYSPVLICQQTNVELQALVLPE